MLQKIKDFSKLTLNQQDVMLKAKVKLPKGSTLQLDLSAMNKADRDQMEEIVSLEIIAKGVDVPFEIGQLVSLKSLKHLPDYDKLNEDTSERAFILHHNAIGFAVNKEDYEL